MTPRRRTWDSYQTALLDAKAVRAKSRQIQRLRLCLRCTRLFGSRGIQNRLCPSCVHSLEKEGPNLA